MVNEKASVGSEPSQAEGRSDLLAFLPPLLLLNNILPSLAPEDLLRLARCCRTLRAVVFSDDVWRPRCEERGWGPFPRGISWQEGYSSRRQMLCVECGKASRYMFALLGCRLCEACEHKNPRYGLVTAMEAIERYGVSYAALAALPHHEACRTLFYLRTAVETLAGAHRGVTRGSADEDEETEEEADEEEQEDPEHEEAQPEDRHEGRQSGGAGEAGAVDDGYGTDEGSSGEGIAASGDTAAAAAASRRAAEKAARKVAKKAAKEAQRLRRQLRTPTGAAAVGVTGGGAGGGGRGGRGTGTYGDRSGAVHGSSPPSGGWAGGQQQPPAHGSAGAAGGRQGGGSRGSTSAWGTLGSSPPSGGGGSRTWPRGCPSPAGPVFLAAEEDVDGMALPLEGQAVPLARGRRPRSASRAAAGGSRGGVGRAGISGSGSAASGGRNPHPSVKLKSGWAAEREALMAAWGQFGISGLVLAS